MRVALLTSANGWRGSGSSYAKLARGLGERGHLAHLVTASSRLTPRLQRMGLQVPPEACLVVEDSPFGIEAARAAGMRALAYAGGGLTSVRELQGPGTVVFHDMADLPYLVSEAGGENEP